MKGLLHTKMKKTTPINLMVNAEVKKRLQDKAKELNLSLTGFFEKIAIEELIFCDNNLKKAFSVMDISM